MKRLRTWLLRAALLGPALLSGCYPLSMGIFTPIPVPPWVSERMEERFQHHKDFQTPVMPPIVDGHRPLCLDPPDMARILRALPRVPRGVPYIYEEHRDDIRFVTELIKDTIDPPRPFPLVGPAQLHHCHWKCTVYYTETIESSYPFPYKVVRPRVQVVYIDLDHLHLYPKPTPELQRAVTEDLLNY